MKEFARVKENLNLQEVIIQETGQKMKGKHLDSCPFCGHRDCFSINSDDRFFKCFSCDVTGDVFTFLQEFHELDAGESLTRAASIAGIELERSTPTREKSETYQQRLYRLAAEYYHAEMKKKSCAGRKWFLETRGHTEETLDKMQAGFTTGKLLHHLKKQGFVEQKIVKYGLAKEGKDDEIQDYFMQGLVVFPVINYEGQVINFTSKDPKKKYPPLMIKGIRKEWFLNYPVINKEDLIIVEGENDIASLADIGINSVIGTAGGPGDDQIRLLKNFCAGKTLYLWFDKDEQKHLKKRTGGAHHIEFIYRRLSDADITVKVITHPGDTKDADAYIQSFLKAGDTVSSVRANIKELKEKSVDPLIWELEQLTSIENTKDSLEVFKARKLPEQINALQSMADQEIYIDLAAKTIGISVNAVEEIVRNTTDLYTELSNKFQGAAGIKKADPYDMANFIYKWFNNGSGARFFKTRDGKCYVFYQRKIYHIGNNLEFNTLMHELTRLAAIERPGTTVWHFLEILCNKTGEQVDLMTWLYTDRERDTIYINLNSNHNKIIRISPGEAPAVIDNGTNEHSVLLSESPQIKHFEYTHNASEAEGFGALKDLIMATTPCEGPQKYFMVCWVLSTFMMNFQSDRGLLQIIASSKIGKSKVAERISQLLYGESYVGKGTGAAETRVAISNPMLFLDNLENRNLTQGTVDFLLLLANSSHKPKAKSGSDNEVLYQKLFTMAVITSIEAFPGKLPELVNRAFPLMLEHQFKQQGYMHDEVMRQILKKRSLILSVILKMIGEKVLPNLEERTFWSKYIQGKFPGHYKDRNNEHICMMMIILEAMLDKLPWKKETEIRKQATELLDHWIGYWNEQEGQTAMTSNTLLNHLDGLAKEIMIKSRSLLKDQEFQPHKEFEAPYPHYLGTTSGQGVLVKRYDDNEYNETFFITAPIEDMEGDDPGDFLESFQRIELILTAAELYTLLNRYCANQHVRNPFEGPNALGARISNDREILKRGGWELISRKEGQSHYKKIGGKNYWRFSKKVRQRI